jgi:uncharacterized membrane protein
VLCNIRSAEWHLRIPLSFSTMHILTVLVVLCVLPCTVAVRRGQIEKVAEELTKSMTTVAA